MAETAKQRLPLMDEENIEEWERLTDDPDLRGVEAFLSEDDDWRVGVAVAEFVREDPLESELVTGVENALRSVPGVTNVWREDREQWVAEGVPQGGDLVNAVARFIDDFADRARKAVHGEPEPDPYRRIVFTKADEGWDMEMIHASGLRRPYGHLEPHPRRPDESFEAARGRVLNAIGWDYEAAGESGDEREWVVDLRPTNRPRP